ncbi:hypothetical protein IWZ01DRAFT_495256 [Phyllosticta capitalensis]
MCPLYEALTAFSPYLCLCGFVSTFCFVLPFDQPSHERTLAMASRVGPPGHFQDRADISRVLLIFRGYHCLAQAFFAVWALVLPLLSA